VRATNRYIVDWGAIFDDTIAAAAILDRLLHHAAVLAITGDSYPHARPPRRHRIAPPAITDSPAAGAQARRRPDRTLEPVGLRSCSPWPADSS
jgi:hypothetical protein